MIDHLLGNVDGIDEDLEVASVAFHDSDALVVRLARHSTLDLPSQPLHQSFHHFADRWVSHISTFILSSPSFSKVSVPCMYIRFVLVCLKDDGVAFEIDIGPFSNFAVV